MVLGHILHLHGAESSKTHMKSDMSDIDALGPDLLQKLRREMKACCGSSRGAVMLCINGLVTVLVLQLMSDIGRQGHLAQFVQNLLENALVGKLNQTISFLHDVHDFSYEKTFTERNLRADLCLFSRFHQRLPDIVLFPFQKEHLDLGVGSHLCSVKSCRDHLRIVDDQAVPGI